MCTRFMFSSPLWPNLKDTNINKGSILQYYSPPWSYLIWPQNVIFPKIMLVK